MPQESLQDILERIRVYFPGACEDCPGILALAKIHEDVPQHERSPYGRLPRDVVEIAAEGIGKIASGLCSEGATTKIYSKSDGDSTTVTGAIKCGLGVILLTSLHSVFKQSASGHSISMEIPDTPPDFSQ